MLLSWAPAGGADVLGVPGAGPRADASDNAAMQLIRDWFSLDRMFPGAVLTIGNFDGVHVGHQRILACLVAAARRENSPPVVFTFDVHPDAVLHPDRAPDRILTFDRKLELLEAAGVHAVICPDGPLAVLAMDPEDFVRRVIVEGIGAALVVEGPHFVFGRDQRGNDELLKRMGPELGFRLEVVDVVIVDDAEVSSTRIRHLVRAGRVAEAHRLLGRPFEFVGRVVHGGHRGHGLGFPTANLAGGDFLVPGDGVYAGWARLADHSGAPDPGAVAAAISVGREPTFGELPLPVVEANLLDFDEDLYGRGLRLEFLERLRGQETFADEAALAEQVRRDREVVRALLTPGP